MPSSGAGESKSFGFWANAGARLAFLKPPRNPCWSSGCKDYCVVVFGVCYIGRRSFTEPRLFGNRFPDHHKGIDEQTPPAVR